MHSDLCAISHGPRSVLRGHVIKHNRRGATRDPLGASILINVLARARASRSRLYPYSRSPHRVQSRKKHSSKFDSEIGEVTRTTPEEGVSGCAADGKPSSLNGGAAGESGAAIGSSMRRHVGRTRARYDVYGLTNGRRGGSPSFPSTRRSSATGSCQTEGRTSRNKARSPDTIVTLACSNRLHRNFLPSSRCQIDVAR